MSIRNARLLLALAGALIACTAGATTYSDNFQYGATNQAWNPLGNACLTSPTSLPPPAVGNTNIPICGNTFQGGASYTIPADEQVGGQGALLLTPPNNNQTGAILSAFPPFPLSQGIQITFTTYTFGGDSGGLARNGADGIVFFLTDGTKYASDGTTPLPTTTGAEGGSMGYDCSNDNGVYDGIAYGYLGLGIDEYGNFLNTGDNGTNPQLSPNSGINGGIYNSNDPNGTTANGNNSYYRSNYGNISAGTGPQYQPERIGLRGAGNTNYAWLHGQNSTYYSSPNASEVQWACKHGMYVSGYTYNYWGQINGYKYSPITYNYNAIPGGYAILPDSEPIANNSKSATRNPTSSTKSSDIAWPITYKLSISAGGLLNFAYSYNNGAFKPVLANFDITKANGPLPASLRFGFSAGTGGDNNVHEITCFQAAPLQANSSAGSNTVTGKVTGNSQFFLASYSSDGWWGSLVADPLVIQSDGTLNIGTDANWDAKCVLTGGPCDTMGTDASGNPTHTVTVQSPSSRNLFTWNAGGVALSWANLSTAEQTALDTATSNTLDTTPGQNRVAWLTGDRTVEQLATGCSATPTASPPCDLRARTYVLGDIINSSPTFVGAPTPGALPDSFYDQLDSTAPVPPENGSSAQKYSTFVSSNASRVNVVYAGSNDGFMHGFEAGINGNGGTGATDNDGKEVLGYIPYDVLMNKAVNLTNPLYTHDYLVDSTPVAGDVFYADAWHTWLVGGVDSNGQEIYALDITDPASFSASDVIGDWDSTTLTHLGNTVGTPIITRMHNGDWAIIFGSGLHTNNDGTGTVNDDTTAGVYIGLIDPTTGAVTFQFLDTGVGSKTNPDGLAYVSQVDLDGDHIADYLYAGDTQGNVWRFDVTSSDKTQWKVSTFGAGSPTPLFVAKDASGNRQPITTSITILAVQTGLVTRDMLYFGTGRQTQATTSQGVQYAKGTSTNSTAQTFYGIWDWDMGNWDSLSTAQYASLSSGSVTRSDLLVQTLEPNPDPSDKTHRYLNTTKVVCWQGDAVTTQCPTQNQYGWLFDLPDPGSATGEWAGEGEQVIYNPAYIDGAVVVNTAIPPKISASACNPGLQSGWTMAFDPSTGGGFPEGYFPDEGGGFGSSGSGSVGGTMVSGVGTPTSIEYGGKNYLVTQTVTGGAKLFPINPPSNDNPSRVSWRELVNP
jgi:type IV pilus assembly protein PilY1